MYVYVFVCFWWVVLTPAWGMGHGTGTGRKGKGGVERLRTVVGSTVLMVTVADNRVALCYRLTAGYGYSGRQHSEWNKATSMGIIVCIEKRQA